MEASSKSVTAENARLSQALQRASTENEILKATSAVQAPLSPPAASELGVGPMEFSPTDFYRRVEEGSGHAVVQAEDGSMRDDAQIREIRHRVAKGEGGEKLLAAGATWDFILGSEEFRRGLVDVGRVSEVLKGRARCDGQGPVFAETDILEAIRQSVAGGSDELL